MNNRVVEQSFDMEAYIRKRALEIGNLEERKLFKDTIEHLFMALYHWSEEEYKGLEDRIFGELRSQQNDYAIFMGLTEASMYDATDPFLYPMVASDTEDREIVMEEVVKAINGGDGYSLYKVFLEADYSKVKAFNTQKRNYHGVIKTDQGQYRATFLVEKDETYLQLIEQLYRIFNVNYLPWSSVCTAYLNKFFEVKLCQVEGMDVKEKIQEVQIDFEEYAPSICYHRFPLWNLTSINEKTSTYPEPCLDKTNYEHRIYAHRLDPDSQYLVTNTDVEITNIRRLNGDLIITCPIEYPKQWTLYRINHKKAPLKYSFPVLSNECHESFAGSLSDIYRRSIKTKAEIARLIESYGYQEHLRFSDIALLPIDVGESQTYDMDFFISDELRLDKTTSQMVLYFHAKDKDNYLNLDIMSFIMTQIQKLFPEYHCCGQLL